LIGNGLIEFILLLIFILTIKVILEKKIKEWTTKRYYKPKGNIMTVTKIGEHFNIPARTINKIFLELKWIETNGKWKIPTELGKTQGATEKYDTRSKIKYVMWEKDILENEAFIDAIKKTITPTQETQQQEEPKQETSPQKNKTSYKEKIKKGALYEEYIALIYKANGYTIWEHGKDKGIKDMGIDLIVKKDKKIILIQCKNWNEEGKYKIDHKDIKVFRTEGRDFINKNEIFINYELHLKYIISGDFMHPSAIHHIEECNQENKNVSYEIIKIPSV